jgi:hypothetical protein
MKINPEKIRDVIGKGGAVIRAITEETGTTIDIKDDGTITIASVSGDAADAAKRAHRVDHRRRRSRQGLRRHGAQAARLRRHRQHPARSRRPAAHFADCQRTRQCRCRLSQGRPEGPRQGPRSRREGSRAPVDEGAHRRRGWRCRQRLEASPDRPAEPLDSKKDADGVLFLASAGQACCRSPDGGVTLARLRHTRPPATWRSAFRALLRASCSRCTRSPSVALPDA